MRLTIDAPFKTAKNVQKFLALLLVLPGLTFGIEYIFLDKAKKVTGSVTYIYDGDTIEIKYPDGKSDTVRLLGINAPEIGEPYGAEAKDFTFGLKDKLVTLYIDPDNERDKYNRLLACIVSSGVCHNTQLLELGLASRMFFRNNIINFPEWEKEEVKARKANLGLWQNIEKEGVIISEIQPDPKGTNESPWEFVEFYNKGNKPVNLGSFSFGFKKIVIPQGIIIQPKSFVLLANSATTLCASYPDIPKDIPIVSSSDFYLLNSHDPKEGLVLNLKAPDGGLEDSLTYNLEWDNGKADSTGLSLQKMDFKIKNFGESIVGGCDDLNWNAGTPTPGRENLPSISVFPNEGPVGILITISGKGFLKGEEIRIFFGTSIIATTTTKDFQFTTSAIVDTQPPGSVLITAYGITSSLFATTTFFIFSPVIHLEKMVDKASYNIGDIITYTIYYSNKGNKDAADVIIFDVFPKNTKYISHTEPPHPYFPTYIDSNSIKWHIKTLKTTDKGSVTLKLKIIK